MSKSKSEYEVLVAADDAPIVEQQLEKRFSLWSTVALQVSLICLPLALGTFLSTVVGVGGSPGLLYGFLLAVTCDLIICYSMAELAAAYPHSSAQVHWTYCLAPRHLKRGLSFLVGVLACAGWIFAILATGYLCSMFILALAQVYYPEYVPETFHYYLVYAALVLFGFCYNAFAVAWLPLLTYASAAIINTGTLFIIVTLLVKTTDKQSTSFVWKDLVNQTGWLLNGVVFFLGLLPSIACVTMFDGPAHQTDEIPHPAKNIPRVMVIANTFSAAFAFLAAVVYMYCVVTTDTLLAPIGGQPIVQLMMDSFQSSALTTVGVVFLILTFSLSLVGYVCSTSRLFWAFANSDGLPFGKSFFGKVNASLKVPLNALVLVTTICLVIGTMMFGSATALAAVLGSCMVCANMSYVAPILLLLVRLKFAVNPLVRFSITSQPPIQYAPSRSVPHFCLGRFGLFFNLVSVVWVCFIMIWLNFPVYYPVTSDNMNYACVVLGITCFVGLVIWFTWARRYYVHNEAFKHK